MAIPSFQKPNPQLFLRMALVFSAVLGDLALSRFRAQIIAEKLVFTSVNFRAALIGGYLLVGLLILLSVFSWTGGSLRILKAMRAFENILEGLGAINLVLFFILLAMFPILVLGFYGQFLTSTFPRLFLFWAFVVAGATLLASWRGKGWLNSLPTSALVMASVYLASTFFAAASSFPFSLEWSEVSRYYQASFFFSKQIYGLKLPLPVTHPTRYLLQSVPFLIPDSSLWLHRFWQALLWVGLPLLTGWALARRLKIGKPKLFWVFVSWAYLFLMQGAVFYHLLPCVILVYLGFDHRRPARSFLFVALTSIWAGISRINWVPLPGALAALLFMLEAQPLRGEKVLSLRYLWQPILYFVGGSLVAMGSYALYILNSGNNPELFSSPYTADLLWARLLPNSTFPPGVLLGILIVSAPLLVLLWLRLRQKGAGIGVWRGLGAAILLLVFFLGGLVVSVKIGGGTNLHNLDAYMVLLLTLTVTVAFGLYSPDATKKSSPRFRLSWGILAGLITVPVLFAVFSGAPRNLPDRRLTKETLAQIQSMADEALKEGGQVLFISQRHLLTFHLIQGVPLVHEYEKLFLMEMAISHNDDYLSAFAQDIDQQRFTLIISDPLNRNIFEEGQDVLAPENNAWVRAVSRPVLCAYEPVITYSELGIQLLKPRYGSKCNQ